jgi:2-keto-4-pentenoate hydratase/2-oxohepta-3-ene-1,7-dioic acid hydratase in catechol pathway
MRIIRFADDDGTRHYGSVTPSSLETAELLDGDPFTGLTPTGKTVPVGRLLSPIAPVNILCIGLNYQRHAAESGATVPERPILFIKPTSTVVGPGDPIVLPRISEKVDYECELAIVIGRAALNVSEADALGYVLGYTAANDVSARDWQLELDRQWARGKSFDTFCPLGPVLVTADEVPDPDNLQIVTRVNGEKLQDSNTSDLIFSVRYIISYLSQSMTLLPGTVILTGTPEGVGMGRTPQRWLKDGDQVEVELENVGILANPVRAEAIA